MNQEKRKKKKKQMKWDTWENRELKNNHGFKTSSAYILFKDDQIDCITNRV